jgi:hypothetical protein
MITTAPSPRGNAPDTDLFAAFPDTGMLVTADAEALSAPEPPLLVLHVIEDVVEEVRVVANRVVAVETNLTLGNRDGEEHLDQVDPNGVHRGQQRARQFTVIPRRARSELAAAARSWRCPHCPCAR